MLRFRRIAAILLVSLWLPALLHCRMEAAGLLSGTTCCAESHDFEPAPADACAEDACGVAEGEFTSPSTAALAAPAPVLCACLFGAEILVPLPALAPPSPGLDETEAAPPEIARTWVFVARAALAPRAPSMA